MPPLSKHLPEARWHISVIHTAAVTLTPCAVSKNNEVIFCGLKILELDSGWHYLDVQQHCEELSDQDMSFDGHWTNMQDCYYL